MNQETGTPGPSYNELRDAFAPTAYYLSNGFDGSYAQGTTVMLCRTCGAFTDEGFGMSTHYAWHRNQQARSS